MRHSPAGGPHVSTSRRTRGLAFWIALVLAPAALSEADEAPAATPSASENTAQQGPPSHEHVIAYLREYRGVVPRPLPSVHPTSTVYNPEAIIPPQCYTRTEGTFNPCYVCHQRAVPGRENTMNDDDLQSAYSFSDVGMANHWRNLFEDRSQAVAAISDDAIRAWVAEDNYTALADRLRAAEFQGWVPDLANLHLAEAAFDQEGFALDGSHWVAFNYKPFPSTFWPTNGSTDDVMIRLPSAFRANADGDYSRDVYQANLAIVEANIKGLGSISTPPVDEAQVGADLNEDGAHTVVENITAVGSFVGAARGAYLDTYLYPKGTEFLHTVRYLGIAPNGDIVPSRRMKEVRYMRKWVEYRKVMYERYYQLEAFEKELGNLPRYHLLGDHGLDGKFGWALQGFIEDAAGALRAATYEETLFCMGCHTSVGATIDKTFGFPRKVDGAAGWGYIDLKGMPDAPNRGETQGEIATYLARVGGGGEFRSNPEMVARWFRPDGTVDVEKVRAADVYQLTAPSVDRALALNKAYRVIVAEQDYIYGRDANVTAPANVYRRIDNETAPTLPEAQVFDWDIRLDWEAAAVR